VLRCTSRDGWLILETRKGERAIRMETVITTRWREFWPLGFLVLETLGGEAVELEWVWKREAAMIADACREACRVAEASRQAAVEQRRRIERAAQFDAVRRQVDRVLRNRWPRYHEAMTAWQAALVPPTLADEEQTRT